MSFVRPEARAALVRWREVAGGLAVAAAGLWLASLGGLFLMPLGGAVALVGLTLAWNGRRRMEFSRDVTAPGMVEVDEGRVSFFHPFGGGSVALRDLSEVALTGHGTARGWRLSQPGQPALTVPLAAEGAPALADALTALPGLDLARLSRALGAAEGAPGDQAVVIWSRNVWPEA